MSVFVSEGCATDTQVSGLSPTGAEMKNGRFINSELEYQNSFTKIWDISLEYLKAKRISPTPDKPLPVQKIGFEELTDDTPALYRLGHSTILIRLDGSYFLTDPVFSERASPVQWAGPQRFHELPISLEDLPEIKAVIISHDHYDHLDKHTIKNLSEKVDYFITPLRVGKHLREWGVDNQKIIEKDWWESFEIDSITITATPSQHFSGRGLMDKDHTLWASWVIRGSQANLFFSGDSGYFGGFKEIGDKYGPFDITMIETGAYNRLWAEIHMLPEQSVQAHLDLKGKSMLPIHNSTFDLALHAWYEPLESVAAAADEKRVELLTPVIGERVDILNPGSSVAWWRKFIDYSVASLGNTFQSDSRQHTSLENN